MLLKGNLILSVQGVLQRIPSDGIGLPQIVVPVKLVPEVLRVIVWTPRIEENTLQSFTPILVANR